LPNGIDLEGMFRGGSRWSTIAWILAMVGFFVSIFVTGVSTATGNPQNVLWGLWISIFWLNITVFVLAIGANNQLTAIYWALRGTKDESTFSLKVNKWVKEKHDEDNEKI